MSRVRWIQIGLVACLLAVAVGAAYGVAWMIREEAILNLAQANQWLADTFIHRLGYWGVFALMAVESSFLPLPSELIMPPAGDLARRIPEWSLGGVIVAGTLGSVAGALVNYVLALYVGRPLLLALIRRYGRFVHVSEPAYLRAEALFERHGPFATFIGRLVPGVRHLISIPAGLSRMPLIMFCAMTAAGAGLWVTVLAYLGYWFGGNPQQLADSLKQYSHWLVAASLLAVVGYGVWLYRRRARRPANVRSGR